jgi:pilus assembly protein CpaB
MHARALIMLLVAVVLGVVAVVLVNTLLTERVAERPKTEAVAISPLVVAAVDMPVGTRVEKGMLKQVDWPEESKPEGGFEDPSAVVGEKPEEAPVVLRDMRVGEPVLSYKLSPYGARGGLTVRVPEGWRAMSMDTNEVRGVAGFVLPGDHVDLLHTSTEYRKDDQPATRLLLQNVKVLAVDQASSEKADEPVVVNAVTVLVTPEQGEKITLARRVGEVSLMLRNEADQGISADRLVSIHDLRGMEVAAVTQKPVVKKRVVKRRVSTRDRVRVIKGLTVTNQTVKKEPAGAKETPKTKQAGS